jgi:hypothetical protein
MDLREVRFWDILDRSGLGFGTGGGLL